MPRKPTRKTTKSSKVPEAEKQSTLMLAHLQALEPVLDQLPAEMVIELDVALYKFGKSLKHVFKTKTMQKTCFTCDGSGRMCSTCGESELACGCLDDDKSPVYDPCDDCDGSGVVFVPRDA